MENNNIRKYNTDFRKKIINKIEKINNKDYQIDIYNLIIQDIGNNFSSNRNGLFINLNLLSDNSIDEIINYLENKLIYIKLNVDSDNIITEKNNDSYIITKNNDIDNNNNDNDIQDIDKYFYNNKQNIEINNKQKYNKKQVNNKLSTEEKQIIKNINQF
jgi:hypothetical protein